MQSLTITGRLGKDAELRSTQGGDQVCSFNLAVDQGWGERKTTNWFRVSYWGKRGAGIQPYLLKGTQVAVQGDLEIGEYEGKPQFNVRANNVDLMGGRERQGNHTPDQQNPLNDPHPTADELADDVPF